MNNAARPAYAVAIALLLILQLIPVKAHAGLILNAELKFTYEDNVVGLLSDQRGNAGGGGAPGGVTMMAPGMMGGGGRYTGSGAGSGKSPGDVSATISAEAGGYQGLTESSEVFAKGFANHTSYGTYTDLDATIAGATVGLNGQLVSGLFGQVTATGKVKRFGDSQRNSNAWGGTASLKEKLTPEFYFREFAEYEKNNADNAGFTYDGYTVGAGAGYSLTKKTLLTAGASYLIQKFEQPSGADMKTTTVYVSGEQTLWKSVAVAAEYDLQIAKENITNSSTTDNVFSVALRYSY